jgi:NAD(P)-dependent dehydrogenase (short-subunit alcohol dehydrogenase family)
MQDVTVNLFGTAASIQAFLPLLEKGQGKRLWIVSTQAAASVNGWAGQDISAGCKPQPSTRCSPAEAVN